MWNLAPLLPQQDGKPAFTRRYAGEGELIDHILVSRALLHPKHMPDCAIVRAEAALPDIGDDPLQRKDAPGSDHAAIVVKFQL